VSESEVKALELWREIEKRATFCTLGAENVIRKILARALRDAKRAGQEPARRASRRKAVRRAMRENVETLHAIVREGVKARETA
jgi:hypothetical protein